MRARSAPPSGSIRPSPEGAPRAGTERRVRAPGSRSVGRAPLQRSAAGGAVERGAARLKVSRAAPDPTRVRGPNGPFLRGLAAVLVALMAAGDGGGGTDAAARPARVEAFRSGAGAEGDAKLVARLVRLDLDGGDALLHAELELPGANCRVHLVERLGADGRRALVLRERTDRTVRSLRLERPSGGAVETVIHGEGAMLRTRAALPPGAVGPLERLEDERRGVATAGPRLALDPFTGRARSLVTRGHFVPTGRGAGLRLWIDRDGAGAVQAARLFCGTRLIAWRPAAGRRLALGLDPALHERLRGAVATR